MEKPNCWEFMKCGREPGGTKAEELGICPAATGTRTDGINRGKNGGRACWAVVGSFVSKKDQSPCVTEERDCFNCEFYKQVVREEGERFVTGTEILIRLHILG